MLSLTYETDPVLHRTRPVVKVNSSSISLIQLCKRKAHYVLNRELSSNEENAATLFGSAIHKALEVWYCIPRDERRSSASNLASTGSCNTSSNNESARDKAMRGFNAVAQPLGTLDIGDKRHPYNGERILDTYFKKYADDPFEILIDEKGPVVERRLEAVLIDTPDLKIIYFGTVDCILKDVQTGVVLVTDHKTTSSLGSDFYNRLKPNFQYCSYVWLAQQDLGLDTNMFMVNGIQVAKTKVDLARQVVTYDECDMLEWKAAVEWNVREWLKANEAQNFIMSTPDSCTMWGKCQFHDICAAPPMLKENMISGMFKTTKELT